MEDKIMDDQIMEKWEKKGDKVESTKPYVISREEYKNKIQPSWNIKTPLILQGAVWMEQHPDDAKYSIGLRIEEHAIRYSDKLALLYEDERYTHKQFNEWINRYANYFIKSGLQKGDVAVIFLENRSDYMFIILALGKLGVISSLINTNLREQPLIHSMKHTPGRIYLIGEELYEAFEQVKLRLELTKAQEKSLFFVADRGRMQTPEGYIDLKEKISDADGSNPPTTKEILMGDPFVYIFTSGTTGLPKAAILKNKSILTAMTWWGDMVAEMKPEDIIYITTPLFHSHGIKVAFAAALHRGYAMAIARKFSASKFWDEVRKYNANCFNYVGEICRYIFNQPPKPDDANNPIVKVIGNGLRPEIWLDFKKRFNIPEIREFYGATEDFIPNFANVHNLDQTCGICLTPYAIVKYDLTADEPIRNEKGRMKKVKPGEVGLLLGQITDPENFYMYKDKEATEKKIFRDVFRPGDMFINTGDLLRDIGYGHVQFVDRLGDTFRWKGENVSTQEVESVINIFDQIDMCSVYGVIIPYTEGRAGMVSIHQRTDDSFDFGRFFNFLQKYLPHYAIPKFIRFINEFSFTATHKIKKNILKHEGYNIYEVKDPLFVLLPESIGYIPLRKEIYEEISKGKYRF